MQLTFLIINYGGHTHLERCLDSLRALLATPGGSEIIVVDNGSPPETKVFLAEKFPDLRVFWNGRNEGFARAVNQGVGQAKGRFVFLLNNDVTVNTGAIPPLLAAIEVHPNVVAVAPKMLFDSPIPILDSVGTVLRSDGYGLNRGIGQFDFGQYDHPGFIFGACFGAVMIRRAAFQPDKVGFLDGTFFMYFEDVDWCLRANLLGFDILAEPRSQVIHVHSASTRELPSDRKFYLGARNVLRTILKDFGWPATGIAFRAELDVLARYARIPGYRRSAWSVLPSLVPDFPRLLRERHRLARRQVRSDESAFRFSDGELDLYDGPSHTVRDPLQSLECSLARALTTGVTSSEIRNKVSGWLRLAERSGYLQLLSKRHPLDGPILKAMRKAAAECTPSQPKKVAIITSDVIGRNMAGPGIRALELARALSPYLFVTLIMPESSSVTTLPGLKVSHYRDDVSLRKAIADADSVVVFGYLLEEHPFLKTIDIPLVVDLYSPFVMEALELYAHLEEKNNQERLHQETYRAWANQLSVGDLFLCASERQRDSLLGALIALGRVNPTTYNDDPTFRRLIDVVPFGIPSEPPQHTRRVLKGVFPGISEHDRVLLWGGGLWDWLDPITAIRAVEMAAQQRSDLRLFFMGTRHPNPVTPPMRRMEEARRYALERGLDGRVVFFNDWVSYEERQNYLLEADLGISAHCEHAETRLSFRTRLLDCLWARLPIVCSTGDVLGDMVGSLGLGRALAPGDVQGLAKAMLELLGDEQAYEKARTRICQVTKDMTWVKAVKPLLAFCSAPRHAPDNRLQLAEAPLVPSPRRAGDTLAWAVLKAADLYLRVGPRMFFSRVGTKVSRRIRHG